VTAGGMARFENWDKESREDHHIARKKYGDVIMPVLAFQMGRFVIKHLNLLVIMGSFT
jgi:hypothetical protein